MNKPDFRDYSRLPNEQAENILAMTDDVGASPQEPRNMLRSISDIRDRNASGTAVKNRSQQMEVSAPTTRALQVVYLARHGETAWTLSGQHTGLTDLPLTERGERNARRLQERLRGLSFARVFTSPLQRARRTCELAGFGAVAEIDRDLVEWNYGEYEGRRTADIHRERPDWQIFRDGCPGGESPSQVGARADRAIKRVRAIEGNVLLFSSGHFLRVLAARWIGFEPGAGRVFLLSTASLSALSYEHNLSQPAIRLWDDDRHVSS
jgi:broad specificity phosphatase PhoE